MKPLLAATLEDVSKLRFPIVVSPKLDGVRAVVYDGVVWSRSLKMIPNKHVQKLFGHLEYMDGELVVGPSNAPDVYRQTVSGVMAVEGEPNVVLCVFDYTKYVDSPFDKRFSSLKTLLSRVDDTHIQRVRHHKVETAEELLKVEADYTEQGYEGIMIRDPLGVYKHGRSTLKEGILIKMKRFQDAEATVIGAEELMHNHNEATKNELGYTDRSSHKENLVNGNTLGALVVRNVSDGVEFKIGTGFTQQQRVALWQGRDSLIGKLVTYKFFPVGVKEAPRHPVFKGFRDVRDV